MSGERSGVGGSQTILTHTYTHEAIGLLSPVQANICNILASWTLFMKVNGNEPGIHHIYSILNVVKSGGKYNLAS